MTPMQPVVQEDPTGCGLASVAALAGRTYAEVKSFASQLGIQVSDPRLWSDTTHVRRLLRRFGLRTGRMEEPFDGWDRLPTTALLAIKWHHEPAGPAWHWVVFVRSGADRFVLDPKRALRSNRRTDFGRMKPKWFIRVDPLQVRHQSGRSRSPAGARAELKSSRASIHSLRPDRR